MGPEIFALALILGPMALTAWAISRKEPRP